MEHSGGQDLNGATLAFVGDCCNNVTYDLMRAGTIMGMNVKVVLAEVLCATRRLIFFDMI